MSNPSLILPQSPAYGEDYVYAAQVYDGEVPVYDVLPLTFTRASGGSRINKDGLVQNMPYNLLDYSQNFSVWNTQGSSVTSNSTTAPNGSLNASTIIESNTTDEHNRYLEPVIGGGEFTFSIYLKRFNTDWSALYVFNPAVGGVRYWINLSTLTAGTSANIGSGIGTTFLNLESVGNGWVRASIRFTNPSGSCRFYVANAQSNGGATTYAGNGTSGIYVFGAQVNIGSTAQPYLATTDRLNMPRITYPVGGGCGALLLEKQSTNLVTYSEQFSNAAWSQFVTTGTITITANYSTSPDGTQNADRFQYTGGAPYGQLYQILSHSTNVFSIYAKSNTGTNQKFRIFGNDFSQVSSDFIVTTEWQRFDFAITGSGSKGCGIVNDSTGAALDISVWGAQFEQSSYATSYISTTTASSTRIADVCLTTSIPNLIGQTEGTLFVEMVRTNTLETFFVMLSNIMGTTANAYQNSVYLFQLSNGNFICDIWAGNVPQVTSSTTYLSVGTHKLAVAYKQNDFVVYVDGVQRVVDTSGNVPALNYLTLAGAVDGGAVQNIINETILYKTRLTNSELATLTTL
jgi:hypothetical protein